MYFNRLFLLKIYFRHILSFLFRSYFLFFKVSYRNKNTAAAIAITAPTALTML